jgi:hypothetical protein
MAYLAEISLPKYHCASEYYFLDVLELLILIMIVRREVIHYGIKTKHYELLGAYDDSKINKFDELIYQIRNNIGVYQEENNKEDD